MLSQSVDKCLARPQQRLLHQHSELIYHYSNYLNGEMIPANSEIRALTQKHLSIVPSRLWTEKCSPIFSLEGIIFHCCSKEIQNLEVSLDQQKFNITLLL